MYIYSVCDVYQTRLGVLAFVHGTVQLTLRELGGKCCVSGVTKLMNCLYHRYYITQYLCLYS